MFIWLIIHNGIDLTALTLLYENWAELDHDRAVFYRANWVTLYFDVLLTTSIFASTYCTDPNPDLQSANTLMSKGEHQNVLIEFIIFLLITVKLLWNNLYCLKRYLIKDDLFRSSIRPGWILIANCVILSGKPPRPAADGHHSPHRRGHLQPHLLHGWEPGVPHQGTAKLLTNLTAPALPVCVPLNISVCFLRCPTSRSTWRRSGIFWTVCRKQ